MLGIHFSFNENRSCIEMPVQSICLFCSPMFNENRSCIEIALSFKEQDKPQLFNENRSCIEIVIPPKVEVFTQSLMKTEVVLK